MQPSTYQLVQYLTSTTQYLTKVLTFFGVIVWCAAEYVLFTTTQLKLLLLLIAGCILYLTGFALSSPPVHAYFMAQSSDYFWTYRLVTSLAYLLGTIMNLSGASLALKYLVERKKQK